MTKTRKKHQDFVLTDWQDVARENELPAAFGKKWSWVVHCPKNSAIWYATVLSNLSRSYIELQPAMIEVVRNALHRGLSKRAFERLKLVAEISNEDLGRAISVPMRTLARREKFKPEESERLLRVASVFQKTLEVFEDLDKARRWFSTPKRALGRKTPLEFCDTGPGAEEVEHLLGRIEHGVFA